MHYIKMGDKVNVRRGCYSLHLSKIRHRNWHNVSIGHNALVHGCTVHNNVLIGMGAIVMDGVVVESNSIIAAGAVVLEGTQIESGSIYAGVPAQKVKSLSQKQTARLIEGIANNYVMYSSWFSE